MRKINLAKQALRKLKKLHTTDREIALRIKTVIYSLKDDLLPVGAKRLQGFKNPSIYRVKVGSYRVLYTYNTTEILVGIIDTRQTVYKSLEVKVAAAFSSL
jgi:mRNA-degrading endonuclease RelE of RelBE toxin-antitoxin system